MAKIRLTGATFDASAKTVLHTSFSDVGLAGIQLITNVTDQVIIYNFADTAKGGTLSTDTLTLEYDTTTMDDTDELMILVEDGVASTAINDGGNSITVDGTVAVTNAGLTALNGAIAGTEVQVDVLTMPTTTVQATNLDIRDLVNTDVVTAELSATDNAVLDAIAASVASIDTDTSTIIGHVDGIEALIGTTNTTLTTIDGRVDGLETLVTSTNTKLDTVNTNLTTIDGRVDGLETSNSAIQTAVQLIDDTIFTAGTDTYTEATSKGQALLAVRRDADTTLVNTTNEFAPLQVDANGYLKVEVFSGQTLPTSNASGSVASGAFASGSIASGAFASGSISSGAIAAGAIAAGATSIATTEDTASAAGDHLVKVAQIRLDTPVSGANTSGSGDYTQFIADSFGKTWTAGSYPEDLAHVAGEPILGNGARRIDTPASSAGSSGDWATLDSSAEGALWATLTPTTTGGVTIFKSIDIDESEEEVKATAGNVYGYYFANTTASARYLKFYNATAANVTVGTTTPVITMYLPPTSAGHIGFPYPLGFSTAICVAATTGVADADTGAPGANDCLVMVYYK